MDFSNDPHRRYNILTDEWVLVSPHRTRRPWQGKEEEAAPEKRPKHDPQCYLCPSNTRANGIANPPYTSTFVFQNDFGALLPESHTTDYAQGFLKAKGERGICKVICFHPDHSLTLPEMKLGDIRKVVDTWVAEYVALGQLPYINHVQIFENKGAIMGCSNPHPHGQIWAQSSIPEVVGRKSMSQGKYFARNGSSLLGDYLEQELSLGTRIIREDTHFVALVPFWAVWPYETMIVPKRHSPNIADMTERERQSLARILKALTSRMDNVFQCSFPYSAGIHQAPTDGQPHPEWHWHISFYPPLLRSATVKKFMVGYEMFANPQRDISAEQAAETLRGVGEEHYRSYKGCENGF